MSERNVPQQWKCEESFGGGGGAAVAAIATGLLEPTTAITKHLSSNGAFYTKTNVSSSNRIVNESTSSSSPSSASSMSAFPMLATTMASAASIGGPLSGGPTNLSISSGGHEIFQTAAQLQSPSQPLPPPLSSASSSTVTTSSSSSSVLLAHPNFELQKLSSISKINSLARISGFDGITQMPEDEKLRKLQQMVEAGITDHAKQQILQILDKVSLLKPPERLLLYLRMPGGTPETDPLRQPQNPLGTRSEINHTINWVRSHLEHDPKVSIPKQDVYNDYISYCERVNIKPLSTADFGKVMKQVFPEIRPRRLGTRGHSRYCYAAMRKATKLDPPRLPSLNTNAKQDDLNDSVDEDSWKVIKLWAESLLNANFGSLKDLSTYITKHHSSSPAANSSRLLLQKKLLQRESKEKRKFVDTSPLKKRRKKKRRSSSSSESTAATAAIAVAQVQATMPSADGSMVDIKQEIIDPVQIPLSVVDVPIALMTSLHSHQQQPPPAPPSQPPIDQRQPQMVPMNLATEHVTSEMQQKQKIQGTNLSCDNNLVVGCSTKNLVAPNLSPIYATTKSSINDSDAAKVSPLSEVKEEIPDSSYDSKIYCKKVRQAQQAKGLWNPPQQPISNIIHSTGNAPLLPLQSTSLPYQRVNDGLMGPPAQIDLHSEQTAFKRTLGGSGTSSNGLSGGIKSASPNLQFRAKKLEHDQESAASTGAVKDSNGESVLPENLGIPRERVISICNMDKHELDDYLNNEEENSQDQEAELLQYFQEENAVDKNNDTTGPPNVRAQAYPILENYQLYGHAKVERKPLNQNEEEINQLRYYLQQNLQSNKDLDGGLAMNKSAMQPSGVVSGGYPGGSASASLAMMSQRHHSGLPDCCLNPGEQQSQLVAHTTAVRGLRRRINQNARSCVPNSPNTRRKNFSFVPISAGGNQTNNPTGYFVSPRTTPITRKPPLHKQQSLPASDHHGNIVGDPLIGSAPPNAFMKNSDYHGSISSSAPPSPSLSQQRFRFGPTPLLQSSATMTGFSSSGNLNSDTQFLQSGDLQYRGVQNIGDCGLDGIAERSQSVPLHCRSSPAFNNSGNFPGFSSACSSVAQTPVPPEFADFSDPSAILDIFADASQPPIKLEVNEIAPALLDESTMRVSDLLRQDYDIKNNNNTSGGVNVISRSVPSTPIPMNSYKMKAAECCVPIKINKSMYDMSKSVPTTPIAINNTSFRYSPDIGRDFLINGNTVDSMGKVIGYHRPQPQASSAGQSQTSTVAAEPIPDEIIPSATLVDNELSNYGVAESIIGSDILNNL